MSDVTHRGDCESLTDDERATFQRLADAYPPGHDVGKIARTVLEADRTDTNAP